MTTYLLDVNVLIALVDAAHVQHDVAHNWFGRVGRTQFATCPITENGLLRIIGHPKYPNSPGPPSRVMDALIAIRAMAGHTFWADKISLADVKHANVTALSNHARVTDAYLIALASAYGGKLATMDQKLTADIVPNGDKNGASYIERI